MAENLMGSLFEMAEGPRGRRAGGAASRLDPNAVQAQFETISKYAATWAEDMRKHMATAEQAVMGFSESSSQTVSRFARTLEASGSMAAGFARSLETAMERVLRSTTASIAAESTVQALRSLGLGFYLLAVRDVSGALNAFKSAAIWGSVAGSAITATAMSADLAGSFASRPPGRTVVPATAGAGTASAGGSWPETGAPGGTSVRVLVMGEPQAAQWMAGVINRGVEHQDLRLVASHTKRPAPADW
jgi:hypothetical protein